MPTTFIATFPSHFGYMIKDVASRVVMMAHKSRSARLMHPTMRHMNVKAYRNIIPYTHEAAFIAPSACIIGNVALGHDTSIFYHSCVRNLNTITPTLIGDHTMVMDRCTLMGQVTIGSNTYIGPGTSLDCCEVHDNVYIGPGCTICLGAVIENGAILAAGSVVPKDCRVPAGELWAGSDAEKIGEVSAEQSGEVSHVVHDQLHIAQAHQAAITAHLDETRDFTLEWFTKVMGKMEEQEQSVALPLGVNYPLEARQFMQPRVTMRRPELQMRMSYPVNRTAPWMPKAADQVQNC